MLTYIHTYIHNWYIQIMCIHIMLNFVHTCMDMLCLYLLRPYINSSYAQICHTFHMCTNGSLLLGRYEYSGNIWQRFELVVLF